MIKAKKRFLSGVLTLVMLAFSAGCGDEVVEEETIELLEPVGVAANYEEAAYRNIYNYKIYSGFLCPQVTEYSFEQYVQLQSIDALPGEEVKKGQVLMSGNTKDLDKKIKEKKESIRDAEVAYLEKMADLKEQYAVAKADKEYWSEVVERWMGNEPKPSDPDYTTAKHAAWVQENNTQKYETKKSRAIVSVMQLEASIQQTEELYKLDSDYAKYELGLLQNQRSNNQIKSTVDGTVVSITGEDLSSGINKNTNVIAVGDMDTLQMRTEYINKATITKAEEVFAYVNGKKYDVEYHAISAEEYTKLTQGGAKAYSTFSFTGDTSDIQVGDYGVICVVSAKRDNVLSVPKDAVHKDGDVRYVYVVNGSDSVYTPVRLGVSDNLYAEVLSGVNEKDKILTENAANYKEETVFTTKGEVHYDYTARGSLYYPNQTEVVNPIEYGNCYLVENLVSQYDRVEKGDALATIRVEKDVVGLERQETFLKRLEDRYADYLAGFKETPHRLKDKDVIKAREQKEEQIADVKETIAKMKKDFATVTIKANVSGVVIWKNWHKQDDLFSPNETVFVIADETTNYITLEDKNHLLNYGNDVSISYKNGNNAVVTVPGKAALVNQSAFSKDLAQDFNLITIDPTVLADMAASAGGYEGWWNRTRFDIKAQLRSMDNVVLVPKNAVIDSAGQTFVYVKKADGTVVTQSFISGGADTKNYWAIEGITEGMEICLK